MTLKLFNWILSILIWVVSWFINLLVSVIPITRMPDLTGATQTLTWFWEYAFSYLGWLCNALCLTPRHISLIIDILTLKYLAKPTITIIKIAINWLWGAKDK